MYDNPVYLKVLSGVQSFWPKLDILPPSSVLELEGWVTGTYYVNGKLNLEMSELICVKDLGPFMGAELNKAVCEMIPTGSDLLLVVWEWEHSGIRVAREIFCEIVDDVWHPVSHQLYVTNESKSFMLHIHHEEVAYLFVNG